MLKAYINHCVRTKNINRMNWKYLLDDYYNKEVINDPMKDFILSKPTHLNAMDSLVVDSTKLKNTTSIDSLKLDHTHNLNGSILYHQGRTLMAYRTEQKPYCKYSMIHIVELDDLFQPKERVRHSCSTPIQIDGRRTL